MLVAGLRDAAALLPAAARVLTRDEPDERHELPWAVEPAEVADLSDERERAQGGDVAQAGELAHSGRIGLGRRDTLDVAVERGAAASEMLHLSDVMLEREPLALSLEHDLGGPRPEPLCPLPAGALETSMPDEELPEPLACRGEVLADVVSSPDQVTHGLLLCRRDRDRRELACAVPGVRRPLSPRSAEDSPTRTGMSDGATTSHAIPIAVSCRCSSNPHGPAS